MLSENQLLAALPRRERERLLPDLGRTPLAVREVIYEADGRIRHVYFPTSGVISLLCTTDNGVSIEVGAVGREGMVGVPVFLGVDTSPNRAVVQVAGEALRMKAKAFQEAAKQAGPFHDLLHLYAYALMAQLSLSIVCNRFHSVENRLARWLLMMHDREPTDEFKFTQEFIARMVGARRPHVSTAIGNLQGAGLVHNGWGRIHVLDWRGLEEVSCSCYLAAKKKFDGILGP
jgi:CRP-like cAMP-binding protein